MLEAGLWGLAAASSLVVGAAAGLWLPIPRRVVAVVMAFGAGALVSALSFDLAEEAFEHSGTALTAIGLAAGAVAFFGGNRLLAARRQRRTRGGPAQGPATSGPAIVLGVILDGLPESFVLGATLLGGVGISVSFLIAVFLSNLPEGLAGARDLADEGHDPRWILGLWVVVALVSGVTAAIGFGTLGGMTDEPQAFAEAFAAGGILALLSDTMIPEAHRDGGRAAGPATVLGFAIAFFLSRP